MSHPSTRNSVPIPHDPHTRFQRISFVQLIEQDHGRYVVELPQSEIEFGTLAEGAIVRVSLQQEETGPATTDHQSQGASESEHPVSGGEQHRVEIEDVGDQGDGIARVGLGYVLIVPETEPGDEVAVEVHETKPHYGFATVVEEERVSEQS